MAEIFSADLREFGRETSMADAPNHPEKRPPPDNRSATIAAQGAYGLGIEFILCVLLPGALGYWLDTKWGTRPILMLVGGGFGFAAGLIRLLRASRQTLK